MIASIKGLLLYKKPDHVIIECNGIGYHVNVPISLLSNLPDKGSEVFLHIYTYVREDAIQLYGFQSDEEKKIFIALINISGIGPKIAMSILSTFKPSDLQIALDKEDVATLCRIPGLGKKTAQRLILELRERLPKSEEKTDAVYDDTLSALINLGYKKADAILAIEKAYKSGNLTLESLLKNSLRHLSGNL
ncbi:MAG: Holliday junction branch migration protein RuvA [Thermodesulfovibrionales bacterium]|nr:Holliday junction branch migration protein RuvA [Thermodesulfovibrionales bacterium]